MKNILLINGAKAFAHSNGQLNDTLAELAQEVLTKLGHQVQVTRADNEYDAKAEVEKYLWADTVIYQMPGWWMGAPWPVKKYIDDVLPKGMAACMQMMVAHVQMLQKYGSGGLIHDKNYMLSLTWNAPMDAFTDTEQFFMAWV